jgi:sugar/nucleoside kinase (ribokinase family)
MNPTSFDLIAAGHLCLDMIPRFATQTEAANAGEVFRPGTLVLMGDMTFATGGAVSNVGIAMTVFGCRVGFMARVGDDAVGALIRQLVAEHGSTDGIAVAAGEPSSYTVVLSPPGIDRIFLHCPGTNDTFKARDADPEVIARARLLHFGYPTLMRSLYSDGGEELAGILRRAKEAGVTTSLDISLPDPNSPAGQADWRRIYERALPFVDLFLPSIEESFFTLHPRQYLQRKERHGGRELIDLVSADEVADFADEYLRMGCCIAVIKAGHNGWYLRSGGKDRIAGMGRAAPLDPAAWADRELWCPAFVAERVASSVGSGDCSIAAFLCGLLRDLPIEECLRLANCAGCLNLRAMDATSGLPPWAELRAAVSRLTVRDNSRFLGAPWKWRKEPKLWEKGENP